MEIQSSLTGGNHLTTVVELPLGEAAATFKLEKAVCSHGLFMMAPNFWDPKSKTLQRPLRLSLSLNDPDHQKSVTVKISQSCRPSQSLKLQVFGTDSLSSQQQHSLLNQVRRMLRLSEEDNRTVRDFQEIHTEAKEREFGRIFRSPTLFEDMIKCILLCNCQWPRSLSMATALCELQWELQYPLSRDKVHNDTDSRSQTADSEHFIPKTPAGKETKRKMEVQNCPENLANKFTDANAVGEEVSVFKMACDHVLHCSKMACDHVLHCSKRVGDGRLINFPQLDDFSCSDGSEPYNCCRIGNFPSPNELASLDESVLARRCNLGYRASRILKLAQLVVQGGIKLGELEETGRQPTLSSYNILAEQLKEIDGFGPFTCANVLMCMGFYHVIPSDSETIRHMKQVHARQTTIKTVDGDLEIIYGKYAPFQFLAYWSEVWSFYEDWFGKPSEMPPTNYKLITATNMRPKRNAKCKRKKISVSEKHLQ